MQLARNPRGALRAAIKGATMDALVRIGDVTKRYEGGGQPALDRVSLEVAPGEAVAVMGPSGSEKPGLLSLSAGLGPPISGTVTVTAYTGLTTGAGSSHATNTRSARRLEACRR